MPTLSHPAADIFVDGIGDFLTHPDLTSRFRSLGIAQALILAQTHPMEYRGVRYTIRVRIEREQWYVAIHPAGIELAGKVLAGPRERAESQAHAMIDSWLERQPTQSPKAPSKLNYSTKSSHAT